ncbi:unnamed protein product [Albugo candida]|uniref:Uncharacterized protein n=1 Tax=Albugo candida TaxID=65357 RepID=A0A024GU70_9STRA|nr:unnamed protein product [Albugo candida]|eukprot:CCI50469.1 unnamed protein product [Albugo candida]
MFRLSYSLNVDAFQSLHWHFIRILVPPDLSSFLAPIFHEFMSSQQPVHKRYSIVIVVDIYVIFIATSIVTLFHNIQRPVQFGILCCQPTNFSITLFPFEKRRSSLFSFGERFFFFGLKNNAASLYESLSPIPKQSLRCWRETLRFPVLHAMASSCTICFVF